MRTGRAVFPTMLAVALAFSALGPAHAASASPAAEQGASSFATGQPATQGFPTPDDAIREYLAGVAQADVGRILDASAIDEVSTGFDFAGSVDRLRAFIPTDSLAPAGHPFYADMNRVMLAQRILRKVLMFSYSLLSGEQFDGGVVAQVDGAWAEEFMIHVDPARLAGLTVQDIRFSDATLEHDARYLENAAKMASVYGADDLTERLVLFSFEGQMYDVGFTLVRYGDGWKVLDQGATLAGTSQLGTARSTTVEEYERQTSGED